MLSLALKWVKISPRQIPTIHDENLFFSDNIERGSKNLQKMMSADVKTS